ncbi:hypothetical protein GCM10025867_23220 [Frondihabitans sucicola]|uniref:FAD dependent oxidoreductase domain-containing protein n=1 Tax=Frondihabitans sucicola TaxID=1268041 RepID=A0ABM8GNQ7_9MICO|nr:FAD-dependent oxidoreductase [Frondihabitans sucicola]BDZ50081.1 hypothetical protein GCM10025867_23220 [Frondihabitans sucicola]
MTSLWLDTIRTIPTDEFEPLATYDDVIVGAGLTGLVTALLFARRGHTVAVLEARTVGGLATGSSSAMVSLLQGAQLQKIHGRTYQGVVDAYTEGNTEAFDWLLDYADGAGVDVERRDAFSYATTRRGLARVDAEYLVGRRAGLDLVKTVDVDVPFATLGAVRLRDQAQLDPLELVASLAADVRALGGIIVENAHVTGVDAGDPATTHTSLGDVRSERVHLTTGAPILDRGLYFAKIKPRRSSAWRSPTSILQIFPPPCTAPSTRPRGRSGATATNSSSVATPTAWGAQPPRRSWCTIWTTGPAPTGPRLAGAASGAGRTTRPLTASRSSATCRGAVAGSSWRPATTPGE